MFRTLIGLAACLFPLGVSAQTPDLTTRIATHDGGAFELGMLQTLHAVEGVLQTQYAYGLSGRTRSLPVFRLGVDIDNPEPLDPTPDVLVRTVETFLQDIAVARQTLATVDTTTAQPFQMRPADLWIDINANGAPDPDEALPDLLSQVLLTWRDRRRLAETEDPFASLVIDFDGSDHAWLLAYTHLLSGMGEVILAFDPTPVIAEWEARTLTTFPEIWADAGQLRALVGAIEAEIIVLSDEIDRLGSETSEEADPETRQALVADRTQMIRDRSALREEKRDLMLQLNLANPRHSADGLKTTADWLYLLLTSLEQQPDADRLNRAHAHFLEMIAQNKLFWAAVTAEIDDAREWIPNANQTGAVIETMPDGTAETWQDILADGEALLRGELLIPHFFIPEGYGIDLTSYLADPQPITLIGSVQGIGFYDHVRWGPVISDENWRRFQRLTRGRAGTFAAFLN